MIGHVMLIVPDDLYQHKLHAMLIVPDDLYQHKLHVHIGRLLNITDLIRYTSLYLYIIFSYRLRFSVCQVAT